MPTARRCEATVPLEVGQRCPQPYSLSADTGRSGVKVKTFGMRELVVGDHSIDVANVRAYGGRCRSVRRHDPRPWAPQVEQVVTAGQLRACGFALDYMGHKMCDGAESLRALLARLDTIMDERGVDALNVHV